MDKRPGLSSSTFFYGIGNLFVRSVNFILLPLYSNLITTQEFGNYSLIMSFYAIASVFYQVGLSSGLTKFYIQEKNYSAKEIFSTIFSFVLILSISITVVLSFFYREISHLILGSTDYANIIFLILWTLLVDTLIFYILHLLKTKELVKKVVLFSSIAAFSNLILNVFLVYYLKLSVEGIILSQLLSGVIVLIVLIAVISKEYSAICNIKLLKKVLNFSYPLFIAGIFSILVDVADRFIIDYFLDKEKVGIYAFSYRIAMVMYVFVISFRAAWTPRSINLFNQKDYQISYGKTFTKLVSTGCLILLLVSLIADDLFKIKILSVSLFNSQYESGLVILPYVLSGQIFNCIASYYSVYPYVSGKSYHFLIADILAFGCNIVLNIILIPIYNISGAAFATMVSFFVSATYLFLISRREIKISYQVKKLILISLSSLILLAGGIYWGNFVVDVLIIAVFIIILRSILNIDLKNLIRLRL